VFPETGGVVEIEAEAVASNIVRNIGGQDYAWTNAAGIPGASGSYMEALPNNNINQNTSWLGVSPEMQYTVNFNVAGQHYVWIRGYGQSPDDDSVHIGYNGSTNTAAAMSLTTSGAWQWSTNRTGFTTRGTINASTGIQTLNVWMREDGMRLDKILLTTNLNFRASLGNCFHIPGNAEVNGITMRSPTDVIQSNTAVFLYTGNQDSGAGGNPGNQLQTGSTIFYKHSTNTTWTALPMFFYASAGNNKYYSNSIPANIFSAGDVVQYYFRIPYSDHLTTFIGGNNVKYEIEADAQDNPFSFTVLPQLQPSGPVEAITQGAGPDKLKAQVFANSGHIQVIGQALDGSELAVTNTYLPALATIAGNSYLVGPVLSATQVVNGVELRQALWTTSVVARLTFPHQGVVRYEVVDWGGLTPSATTVMGASDAGEHFYGFGEKFNDLDQAGKKTHIITDDPPGSPKGDKSYKVAPWFLSTRGYGFHFDSTAESYFDMRATAADRFIVNNLFGGLKYNVVWGPKLTDALTRYTGYTGRPQMSPPWAFAPWMSSDRWSTGGEVRYVLTKYRERGIPGSVFVFDSPWEIGYNDFAWNMTQFGNGGTFESLFYPGFSSVTDMMTFLRTNGWKAVCWMTPFINTNSQCCGEVPGQNLGPSANYAEGAASNYFVRASQGGPPFVTNWWKGTGSPVDYTNPDGALWIRRQLSNLVAQSGGVIGGFKTDDGESGNPPGSYIPKSAVYFDGRTGAEMQNGYAVEYHKTIWNVLGTNGVLFARSGFTGSQAYPGYWAGDNEPNFGQENGLQSVIVAGLSAAVCGYSTWSHDIGGYQNTAFSSALTNLFMRWTQFGAFSPLMQMHRKTDSALASYYPWGYGADALTNYQFFAKLHTALFPYIYSYATEASTNGLPIMRPLVLMNQTDANTYGVKHTYLFGNELLVAPVITNVASTRQVYLPVGTWFDFFTNVRYAGGQNILWTNANQSQMPLFVRQGAIIPLISTNVQTLCDAAYVANPGIATMTGALEFMVYPTTNSSFSVYDGTTLSCQSNGTVITATLNSEARPVVLRFFAPLPAGVERDGIRQVRYTNATDFAASGFGWFYDSSGFVNVKFNHPGGISQIAFSPDSLGDGVPDSWRAAHFGTPVTTNASSCAACDPDGDGLSNLQEYLAGTAPLDPSSVLRVSSASRGGNGITIGFATVLGIRNYGVEYITDLATGTWQVLTDGIVGTGALLPIVDSDAAALPARFYRVRLLP
jgi:alpha-D-xyloside xylohydrolase